MGKKIIYCNINGLYLFEKVFNESDLHLLLGGNMVILRRVKDERGASAYRLSILLERYYSQGSRRGFPYPY